MNEAIAYQVLQAIVNCGVKDIVFCSGARNAPFLEILQYEENLSIIYCPEERSAAFFALGQSRQFKRPVAIIVTSGTAAGELLPAAMEAYYSSVPLLLITADRPSCFRGSGAPQAADQFHLFGHYARFFKEIESDEPFDLSSWDKKGAAHLNVCLQEPVKNMTYKHHPLIIPANHLSIMLQEPISDISLNAFLNEVNYLLVIVGSLDPSYHFNVVQFLEKLACPLVIEGISGIREHPQLQHLRLHRIEQLLKTATTLGYPIDGVLRIGGVPTVRLWRDLESCQNKIKVHSISDHAFSGLSWNLQAIPTSMHVVDPFNLRCTFASPLITEWLESEQFFYLKLLELFKRYPLAEPSLMHELSKIIPAQSHVYLGNSLPIREWDLSASTVYKHFTMTASRGLCGIDGQLSTFLGLAKPTIENWAILGDLTAIYDMAGFFVVPQLNVDQLTVVVINNGGGKIFESMFPYKEMINRHNLSFEGLAMMWKFNYTRWESIPLDHKNVKYQLIEIVPDAVQTEQFWACFQCLAEQPLSQSISITR